MLQIFQEHYNLHYIVWKILGISKDLIKLGKKPIATISFIYHTWWPKNTKDSHAE